MSDRFPLRNQSVNGGSPSRRCGGAKPKSVGEGKVAAKESLGSVETDITFSLIDR